MRVLFLSAQIPGHLDWGGYLPTATEMSRRGHATLWASTAEVTDQVQGAGVPFHALSSTGWRWPPPPPLDADAAPDGEGLRLLKQQRALDQWLDVERVARAAQEIRDLGRDLQPNLMVSEMFVAASGLAAEILDVPLVIAGWPAPAPGAERTDPMVALARGRLQDLLSRFRLSGRNWTEQGPPALLSPHLHVTYWSPRWFDGVPTRRQTRHVGGTVPTPCPVPPVDLPSPVDAPWVLITLGTSFNRDPNFFIAASHSARRMGCLPLVVFGSDLAASWIQETLPRLPETAVVRARVDFATVLPYLAAAIHHGGAGTTHALVVHAVPQIVVPHAADQSRQARGVARTGIGLHIPPRNATIDALVSGLSAVLPDLSVYRKRAAALQAEFHALGGIPAAADLLERLHNQTADPSSSISN
jgi:UDP:flavonoid glycosyltransferase YjiC (YdhE family)